MKSFKKFIHLQYTTQNKSSNEPKCSRNFIRTFLFLDENFFTRYLKNLLPPEAPCFLFFAYLLSKNKKNQLLLYTKTKKYGQLTQDSKKPPLFSTWTKFFSQVPKKPFTAGGSMLSLFCNFVVQK